MSTDVTKYQDKAMFTAEPMESNTPKVHLVSATPDPLGAIAAACRMYEGKGTTNLADVTDEERRHYWLQVQKTHLKAPLEFVDLHFFIEGVTRSFTHQMVRQRTAVFAQESMRFAVKDNMAAEAQLPPSLQGTRSWLEYRAHPEGAEAYPTDDKHMARRTWDEQLEAIGGAYNQLVGMGMTAEDARGILPHSTTTRLNYKTNLRNLLDHAGNRLCTQAQFEWRHVFSSLVQAIRSYGTEAAWQWQHIADSNVFKPVCFELGHCPFTADFDRGCTIRDRVQAGEFDAIQTAEWLADPTAAYVK